jgi:hypothetical protein
MPLAGQLGSAQLVEHYLGRRRVNASKPAVSHHVRLPPTHSAAPLVALEAQQPQTFVVFVVAAFDPAATLLVRASLRSGSD